MCEYTICKVCGERLPLDEKAASGQSHIVIIDPDLKLATIMCPACKEKRNRFFTFKIPIF